MSSSAVTVSYTTSFSTTGRSTAYAIQVRWQATDTGSFPSSTSSATSAPSPDTSKKIGIGLGVPLGVLVAVMITAIIYLWCRKSRYVAYRKTSPQPADQVPYYAQIAKAELPATTTPMPSTYNEVDIRDKAAQPPDSAALISANPPVELQGNAGNVPGQSTVNHEILRHSGSKAEPQPPSCTDEVRRLHERRNRLMQLQQELDEEEQRLQQKMAETQN